MIAATVALAGAPDLPRLTQRGKDFVDPSGKPVALRGVNLGGWLVEEIWMTPWQKEPPAGSTLKPVNDHVSLWGTIEGRLGRDAMLRIRKAWRENWITDDDFARIKRHGFNHVRLPFLDRLLEEKDGMATLRRAVAMAKKHGLYVVLDLHGAPGGQNDQHHSGQEGRNRLWFDPGHIDKMELIWTRLAREFGKDPTVAIFDLMNEPMGAPNPAMLHLTYDRVVRAVHKVNQATPFLIDDGYKGFETTPHLEVPGWKNAGYSLHFYNFDAKQASDHVTRMKANLPRLVELQGYRNAPLYIGEFNFEPHSSPDVTREVIGLYNAQGWSWALWTYKTMNPSGPMGQWGLYSYPKAVEPLNPFSDDEATLLRKMPLIRTSEMRSVPGLVEALTGVKG